MQSRALFVLYIYLPAFITLMDAFALFKKNIKKKYRKFGHFNRDSNQFNKKKIISPFSHQKTFSSKKSHVYDDSVHIVEN